MKKEQFLKKLGTHIAKVRASKGYSQDRIYLESGGKFSRATMSRIEAGAVDAQIYTFYRVSKIIGVPLKRLLDIEE